MRAVNPREMVDRYVARANAGDLDALLNLFAENAVVEHPAGRFEGRDQIGAFYRDGVFPVQAELAVADYEDRGAGCRVVFESTTESGGPRQRVVARITLDDTDRIAYLHSTVEDLPQTDG